MITQNGLSCGRLTVSVNNKMKFENLKSENWVSSPPKVSKILKYKLNYGRYHEPVALNKYEQYMRSQGHNIQVEKVGLFIDYANYFLGATPDGTLIDSSETIPHGIIEIKCSEEYKENDAHDICFIYIPTLAQSFLMIKNV